MIVIVTGMDNTGKSTLIEYLASRLRVKPIKSCGPVSDLEQLYWANQQYQLALERPEQIYLFDRFTLLDERVYGLVVRGKDPDRIPFNWDGPLNLIKCTKHLIVYTRPGEKTIFQFGEREQMKGVVDKASELLKEWDDTYFRLTTQGYNLITYDWENENPENLVQIIKQISRNFSPPGGMRELLGFPNKPTKEREEI